MTAARRLGQRAAAALLIGVLAAAGFALASPALAAPSLDSARIWADIDFGRAITFELSVPWTEPAPAAVDVHFGLPGGIVVNRRSAEFDVDGGVLRASHAWLTRAEIVPGAEIEYRFHVDPVEGGTLLTPPVHLTYIDASLPWTRAADGQVEIWYHDGGRDLEDDARAGVRGAVELMRDRYGVELRRPTRLMLYGDADRMRAALGGGTSPWVGGAALAEFNVIVLHADPVPRFRPDLAAVIAHEITHIVIEHSTENPYGAVPAWLHEGLATVVEAVIFERFPYDEIVADAVASNEFVSLRGITGTFPASGRRAVQAYAQSNSLVEHIEDRWGAAGVTNLLEAYAGGRSDGEAVRAALGVTLDALERDWLASLGVEAPVYAALTDPDSTPAAVPPDGPPALDAPSVVPEAAPLLVAGAAVVALVVTVRWLTGVGWARRRLGPR